MSADPKKKLSKEEVEKRLAMNRAASDLDKVKKEMRASNINENGVKNKATNNADLPLQSLNTIGRSPDEIYVEALQEWQELLKLIGEYTFSADHRKLFFPNNKITNLVVALKRAKLDMVAFNVMDIFKTRVKQRNGNKIPTIKEKAGLFGKTTVRQMKPEEIAKKYEIEDNIPEAEDQPLTNVGTKKGIMNYLQETLLENEEIQDPMKKGARKPVAYFLQTMKLIDSQTKDPGERQFLACLLTPEKFMPRNREDVDGLSRLTALFKKGKKWLETKMNEQEECVTESQNKNQK